MTTFASRTRDTVVILFGWVIATTPVLASPQSAAQDPGDQLWASRYDGPDGGDDEASEIGVSPDGSTVFVAGDVNGPAAVDEDIGVVAYHAASGDQLWDASFEPTDGEYPISLAVSPQGELIFVSGSGQYDYITLALDSATGAQVWKSSYDSGNSDTPVALAVSPDGTRVYVTGSSYVMSRENDDYSTVAYDAVTGVQLWASHYGHSIGGDNAQDIAVSPDGSKVFVTGHTEVDRDRHDYATVAYDSATGATLWAKRFDGSIADYGLALGVSPDGSRVFVTGSSGASFTTVAYDPTTGARL